MFKIFSNKVEVLKPKEQPKEIPKKSFLNAPISSVFDQKQLKGYTASFATGYLAGITGEITTLLLRGKCDAVNITKPAFRDSCVFSGTQQVAKEISKNTLKLSPYMVDLLKTDPFLFGASTGLPMWFLTRLVANPVQNARAGEPKPFKGFSESVINETPYYVIKNGLDEFCAAKIFSTVVPKISNFWGKRCFVGLVSGLVGGGCYVLTWPAKTCLNGIKFNTAFEQFLYATPKVFVKKITYTVARPHIGSLIQ